MKLRDTAVRLRAPLVEGYGGRQTRDWPNAVQKTLHANVQPISSAEDTDQRQTTTTKWRMFIGPTDDVLATDRFEWAGRILEVDGDVEEWRRGGRLKYQVVILVAISDNQASDDE